MEKYIYKGNDITISKDGTITAYTYEKIGIVETICTTIKEAIKTIDKFSVLKPNVTSGAIKFILSL